MKRIRFGAPAGFAHFVCRAGFASLRDQPWRMHASRALAASLLCRPATSGRWASKTPLWPPAFAVFWAFARLRRANGGVNAL